MSRPALWVREARVCAPSSCSARARPSCGTRAPSSSSTSPNTTTTTSTPSSARPRWAGRGGAGRVSTTATCAGAALLRGARLHPAALVQGRGGVPLGQGGGQGQERRPLQVPPSPSSLEVQTKVHPKVRNHGEGPYKGLLLVESGYYRFHI